MDNRSKHTKTDCCLRQTMKPGSNVRWKLENTEALKQCGAGAVKATVRKFLRPVRRRAQLAKLAHTLSQKVLGDIEKKEKMEKPVFEERVRKRPAAACMLRQPEGAMAPLNTTQYLMGNAYEDMPTNIQTVPVSHDSRLYSESMSPRSVYEAMDRDYEGCLDFQQRDFDEVFTQYW